jgi:hypothetical protein
MLHKPREWEMNTFGLSAVSMAPFAASLLALLGSGAIAYADTALPTFPPDTEVHLATTKPLSSATAMLGEKVDLTVTADVAIDQQVVIPKGSQAVGTVVFARKKAMGGMPGALDLRADYVSLGEQKIELRSRASRRGANRSLAAAGLAPVGIGIFMQGSNIDLPAGSELLAYVAARPVAQSGPGSAPAWMPPPKEGKGLVFFFRAKDKSNPFLSHQKIKIDDQVVGTMENDHYFYTYVDPGEHRIESSMSIVRLFRIAAGEVVYFQGRIVVGIWLSDMDPDVAQDLIAGLEYTAGP